VGSDGPKNWLTSIYAAAVPILMYGTINMSIKGFRRELFRGRDVTKGWLPLFQPEINK
jgi:L-asparaginase/Glu-tRNA(Gln) amidotransferase subunit D